MAEQSRLDVLEGRVEELSRHWDRLFGEIGRLDQKRARRAVWRAHVSGSHRCARAEVRSAGSSSRSSFDALEQKFDRRFETIDRKMDDLRAELSKQFRWTFSTMLALLGMMLTVGAGVATALIAELKSA